MSALQTAIRAKLAGISAPVYDSVPDNATAPYVVIGDDAETPVSMDGRQGLDVLATIEVWTDVRGRWQAKAIQAEVNAALHRQPLAVTGYNVLGVDEQSASTEQGGDGVHYLGTQVYRIFMVAIV